MDEITFSRLRMGDLVKPSFDCRIFVVTANYGNRATAVATIDMTNPQEWELVSKVQQLQYQGAEKTGRP